MPLPQFRLTVVGALVITALASQSLRSQAPKQAGMDSLLVWLANQSDWSDFSDMKLSTSRCSPRPRAERELCEALIGVRAGSSVLVPRGVVSPEHQIIGPDNRGVTINDTFPNTNLSPALGFPTREMARAVADGRKQLVALAARYPDWDAVVFGLAMVALDIDNSPDSAVRLLERIDRTTQLSPGIIQLANARALIRRNQIAEGAAALMRAIADPSRATQQLLEIRMRRVMGWKGANLRLAAVGTAIHSVGVDSSAMVAALVESFRGVPATYPIMMHQRIYRLERGGSTTIVVPLSLYRQNLERRAGQSPGQVVFPVRVRLIAIPEGGGAAYVVDSLRDLATSETPPRRQALDISSLQLQTELSLPPGRYIVMLTVRQPSGGTAQHTFPIQTILPTTLPSLRVSDLVVGVAGSGLQWRTGLDTVRMNPVGEWQLADTLALFAQLSGLRAGDTVRFTIEMQKLANLASPLTTTKGEPGVRIGFTEIASGNHLTLQRTLSLRDLKVGAYCAVLTIEREGEKVKRTDPIEAGAWTPFWRDWVHFAYAWPVPQSCEGTTIHRQDMCLRSNWVAAAPPLPPYCAEAKKGYW